MYYCARVICKQEWAREKNRQWWFSGFPTTRTSGEKVTFSRQAKGDAFSQRAQWGSGTHCHGKLWMIKIVVGSKSHQRNSQQKSMSKYKDTTSGSQATELQIVRGQERIAGMYPFMLALSLCSSLNICYCLATVRARHWTSGLSSMAVMFVVKSPKCEERETTENWERWQGLS